MKKSDDLLYYAIWVRIFLFCNDQSLLSLRGVSRILHEISDSEVVWEVRAQFLKQRVLEGIHLFEANRLLPSKFETIKKIVTQPDFSPFRFVRFVPWAEDVVAFGEPEQREEKETATKKNIIEKTDNAEDKCRTLQLDLQKLMVPSRYRKSIISLFQNSKLVVEHDLCPFTNPKFLEALCYESMMYSQSNLFYFSQVFDSTRPHDQNQQQHHDHSEKSSSTAILNYRKMIRFLKYFSTSLVSIFYTCFFSKDVELQRLVWRCVDVDEAMRDFPFTPNASFAEKFTPAEKVLTGPFDFSNLCPSVLPRRILDIVVRFEEQKKNKARKNSITAKNDNAKVADENQEDEEEYFLQQHLKSYSYLTHPNEDIQKIRDAAQSDRRIYFMSHILNYEERESGRDSMSSADFQKIQRNIRGGLSITAALMTSVIHRERIKRIEEVKTAHEIWIKVYRMLICLAIAAVAALGMFLICSGISYYLSPASSFGYISPSVLWLPAFSEDSSSSSAIITAATTSYPTIKQYQIADSWFSAYLPFPCRKDAWRKFADVTLEYFYQFPKLAAMRDDSGEDTSIIFTSVNQKNFHFVVNGLLLLLVCGGELWFCWEFGRTDQLQLPHRRFKQHLQIPIQFILDLILSILSNLTQMFIDAAAFGLVGFPVSLLFEVLIQHWKVFGFDLPLSFARRYFFSVSDQFQQNTSASNSNFDSFLESLFKATPGYILETASIKAITRNITESNETSSLLEFSTIQPLFSSMNPIFPTFLVSISFVLFCLSGYLEAADAVDNLLQILRCASWGLWHTLFRVAIARDLLWCTLSTFTFGWWGVFVIYLFRSAMLSSLMWLASRVLYDVKYRNFPYVAGEDDRSD